MQSNSLQPNHESSLDEKRQEAKEYFRELRKMYTALKAKIKRFEKMCVRLNEEKDSLLIAITHHSVQLALNKCQRVEKHMILCKQYISQCDKEYRILMRNPTHYDGNSSQEAKRILSFYYGCMHSIRGSEEEIRIAHNHLKKVDGHLALLRKYNRLPQGLRISNKDIAP